MALDLTLNCSFHSFDHLFTQCPVNMESNAVIIDGMINITGNTANISIIELMDNPLIRGVILIVLPIRTNGTSIKNGKNPYIMKRSVTNHNPPAIISNSTTDRYKTKLADESMHKPSVRIVCALGLTLVFDSNIFIFCFSQK